MLGYPCIEEKEMNVVHIYNMFESKSHTGFKRLQLLFDAEDGSYPPIAIEMSFAVEDYVSRSGIQGLVAG